MKYTVYTYDATGRPLNRAVDVSFQRACEIHTYLNQLDVWHMVEAALDGRIVSVEQYGRLPASGKERF